jgi:maltooligosyltrehalose trehalohydrolase
LTRVFALERGARPLAGGGVRFAVWAPRARRVAVRLVSGEPREQLLEPVGGGVHVGVVAGAGPGADYGYRLDGGAERPDPVSRHQPAGVHGPSRVVDPDAFAWSDAAWRGVERPDLVIQELHVGTFSEAGTFDGAIEHLAALRDLGLTAIELMPVAQFPGARNWGYDGVHPYAPQNSYGGPEGLRRLVDAAHAHGLAVILDVVYNHLGPEGNVLADFGPYFTDAYRTPWGDALNFDGPCSDEVRRYFTDNARYWIQEYHLDGLRLDAVHAIVDPSARPFLAELADAVHRLGEEIGRRVHVIAESDANDPRLVRAPERGGFGMDAVWNDDFHHAVHVRLTGESDGYYADFAGPEPLLRVLEDRWFHQGGFSSYRRRRHGAPAGDVATDRFVAFVQNHDQVGNRAFGERLAALVDPSGLRLAAALLLLSPYVPLLFMGEEYGEVRPFLYFVDHGDAALLEAVRQGRRREFARFGWAGEIPDPADAESFRRSRLGRERAHDPEAAGLRALYGALLALRRAEPALRPGGARVAAAGGPDGRWVRLDYRPADGPPAFAVFHFGREPDRLSPPAGAWRLRLSTDARAFGGGGVEPPEKLFGEDRLPLPPRAALFYAGEEV